MTALSAAQQSLAKAQEEHEKNKAALKEAKDRRSAVVAEATIGNKHAQKLRDAANLDIANTEQAMEDSVSAIDIFSRRVADVEGKIDAKKVAAIRGRILTIGTERIALWERFAELRDALWADIKALEQSRSSLMRERAALRAINGRGAPDVELEEEIVRHSGADSNRCLDALTCGMPNELFIQLTALPARPSYRDPVDIEKTFWAGHTSP